MLIDFSSVCCSLSCWLSLDNRCLMDEWMTCDLTSFLTVFQSYQDDVRMIMKGCVQWNSVKVVISGIYKNLNKITKI